MSSDPKAYWKLVDKIQQATNGRKCEPNDLTVFLK